jgi:DNA-binding CsgD family transcriptional regulator
VSDLDLGFLGLSPLGLAIWEQVALRPYASAEAIAELLGATPEEVTTELRTQAENGQVRSVGGAWVAQDLAAWLDAAHAREQAEQASAAAERARQRADLLRSHLPSVHRQGTRKLVGGDGTETINLEDVNIRIVELVEQAAHSLRFMLANVHGFEQNAPVVEALIRAAGRGVRLSSVWTPDCIDAARRGAAGKLPPLGWVRSNPDVPYRAVLKDDDSVLVQRLPGDLSHGALVINHPPTVALYANLIDGLFADGEHLVQPDGAGYRQRQQDSRIIQLIAAGTTNKAIGVQIGYSERTVQRRVSELMAKYDASSRVELVVKAADLLPPQSA